MRYKKLSNMRNCLFIIFLTSLFTSCSLDENVYDFIESENYYKTTDQCNSALITAYDVLGNSYYYERSFFYLTSLSTEELTLKSGVGSDDAELDECVVYPSNAHLDNFYSIAYTGINRCNAVIDRTLDSTNRNSKNKITYKDTIIVGEALFLRALHYFNLVRVFGGVPIMDHEITNYLEQTKSRDSISTVYNFIINDLKKAEIYLKFRTSSGVPTTTASSVARADIGRANLTCVKALLAKVYITLASAIDHGTPRYDFGKASTYYTLAKNKSKEIMSNETLYNVGLVDDYADLWDNDKKNSKEHIFSVQFEEANSEGTSLPAILTVMGSGATLPDGTKLGKGWGHSMVERAFYDNWNNTTIYDKGLSASMITELTSEWYGTQKISNGTMTSPWCKKYIDSRRNGYLGSCNFPILRYADVLLIYAEATANSSADSYTALDKVYNRATTKIRTIQYNDDAEFREAIYQFRTYEFCFEADHWFDLVRFNKLISVLKTKYGKTGITESSYFFPLPQRAIDLNNKLVQY